MQDTKPLPWGALDRFQAHYIVRHYISRDPDALARTVLATEGHFGGKKIAGVSWMGGRLADVLNGDGKLNGMIAELSVGEASIFVEPTGDVVRIRGGWKNHIDFGVSREMFDICDRIAGHVKSL